MTSILQRPLPVLTAAMAIAAAIGAATSTTWPRPLGRPSPRADLVVLSRDVLSRPPAAADDVQVQTTIFGGAVVYRRERQ